MGLKFYIWGKSEILGTFGFRLYKIFKIDILDKC